MLLKPFVINSYGRIVFPGNFFPELDFSVFRTLKQFAAVIRRDFGEKAPTDVEIVAGLQAGEYKSRYDLCRDLVLNRFWVNRYTFTMYDKRPTRWGDLPRLRDDVFLPVYKPRDAGAIANAIEGGYRALPPSWDEELEDRSFSILLNVFRNRLSSGGELRPVRFTVSEALADPANRTRHLLAYEPDYLRYTYNDVIDCLHPVPELEALMRQCMILHNQYPWDPSTSTQTEIGKLKDDDYVVAFHPRSQDVLRFIQRVKQDENWGPRVRQYRALRSDTLALSQPIKPYPPVEVSKRFKILPRLEAIAVYEGEVTCTNADIIRNHAYCWSRMSAAEIGEKTGIEERALHPVAAGGHGPACGHERPWRSRADGLRKLAPFCFALAPAPSSFHRLPLGFRVSSASCRRTLHATSSPPARACPMALPKPCACCRRLIGRCCWSARKSSPTRSGRCGPLA